jgi:hypothetical protein
LGVGGGPSICKKKGWTDKPELEITLEMKIRKKVRERKTEAHSGLYIEIR